MASTLPPPSNKAQSTHRRRICPQVCLFSPMLQLMYHKLVFSLRASFSEAHCGCENLPPAHSLEAGYFSPEKSQQVLPMHTINPPWEPSATLVLPAPTGCQSSRSSAEIAPRAPLIPANPWLPPLFPILLEEQGRAQGSQPCWVIRTDMDAWGCLILSRISEFSSLSPGEGQPLARAQLSCTGPLAGAGGGFGRALAGGTHLGVGRVPSLCCCLGLILNPGLELTGTQFIFRLRGPC